MSPDLFDLVLAGALALNCWNVLTVQRIAERQARQIRVLTRRVWILEGRNGANADQARRELQVEDLGVQA